MLPCLVPYDRSRRVYALNVSSARKADCVLLLTEPKSVSIAQRAFRREFNEYNLQANKSRQWLHHFQETACRKRRTRKHQEYRHKRWKAFDKYVLTSPGHQFAVAVYTSNFSNQHSMRFCINNIGCTHTKSKFYTKLSQLTERLRVEFAKLMIHRTK
jgi:hypothetical protein